MEKSSSISNTPRNQRNSGKQQRVDPPLAWQNVSLGCIVYMREEEFCADFEIVSHATWYGGSRRNSSKRDPGKEISLARIPLPLLWISP
jgi:hypothetical protein